ncbi:MAG: ATP-dependent Clp protease proteolytic subunit [Calditrichaeota bacterium]|nr:ATP-dependent Clp protease proteolytic subunit [Calditrichota bacterium]
MWEESQLLSHRIIFLSQPIDSGVANRIISQLLLLEADSQEKQIDLYINCGGGSVKDGLAIIDAIQCLHAPVSTICVGLAGSMAAWILAAGKPGLRFATPNAEVMIHQMSTHLQGVTEDILRYSQRLMRLQTSLINMLAKWTGQDVARIQEDIQKDYFMTAQEALDYGIIDSVLQPVDK